MKLEIQYFPETDTLYVGTSEPANDGYDIAENLIAHAKDDGEVVGITLEHAAKILTSHLREHIYEHGQRAAATVLQDEGEAI